MVKSCWAYNCRETAKKGLGISFHQFPGDPHLRKQWIEACGRVNSVPGKTATLCSKHFLISDFVCYKPPRILKKGVVPSVFNVSNNKLSQRRKKRRITRSEVDYEDTDNQLKIEYINLDSGEETDAAFLASSNTEDNESISRQTVDTCQNKSETLLESLPIRWKPFKLNLGNLVKSVVENPHINKETCEALPNTKLCTPVKTIVQFSDFEEEDLAYPDRVRQMWEIAKRKIDEQKRELSFHDLRHREMTDRINFLVKSIKEQNKSTESSNELENELKAAKRKILYQGKRIKVYEVQQRHMKLKMAYLTAWIDDLKQSLKELRKNSRATKAIEVRTLCDDVVPDGQAFPCKMVRLIDYNSQDSL